LLKLRGVAEERRIGGDHFIFFVIHGHLLLIAGWPRKA
jgi:hypothetical protein